MRRKLRILSPLILLALVGAAGAGIIDPIEERIQRVFPFEVGQEYQFKSSGAFILHTLHSEPPNVWPADSVAEIKISDTTVFGETYFRIPFWSPFGYGYYRYDPEDQMIWQTYMGFQEPWEVPLLELGDREYPTEAPPQRYPDGVRFDWYLNYWGYPTELTAYLPFHDFNDVTPTKSGLVRVDGIPVARYKAYGWVHNPDWGADAWYGLGGPGWCQHGASRDSNPDSIAIWSLFRAKSDEPWPEFDPVLGPLALGVGGGANQPEEPIIQVHAYPNPFNPVVTIACEIPKSGNGSVRIYNLVGQIVRTINEGPVLRGVQTYSWPGVDDAGRPVGSGIYFVRVAVSDRFVVKRVTLVR